MANDNACLEPECRAERLRWCLHGHRSRAYYMYNQNITIVCLPFASALSFVYIVISRSVSWKDWITVLEFKATVMVQNLN